MRHRVETRAHISRSRVSSSFFMSDTTIDKPLFSSYIPFEMPSKCTCEGARAFYRVAPSPPARHMPRLTFLCSKKREVSPPDAVPKQPYLRRHVSGGRGWPRSCSSDACFSLSRALVDVVGRFFGVDVRMRREQERQLVDFFVRGAEFLRLALASLPAEGGVERGEGSPRSVYRSEGGSVGSGRSTHTFFSVVRSSSRDSADGPRSARKPCPVAAARDVCGAVIAMGLAQRNDTRTC
jgi:hypothetical protein